MNTLDIARIMNKTNNHVRRDIEKHCPTWTSCPTWITDELTNRKVKVYEIKDLSNLDNLSYGELLLSKIENENLKINLSKKDEDFEEYKKRFPPLEDEIEELVSDFQKIINQQNAEIEILKRKNEQLKDQLMMKDTQYQGVITDNDVLRESNKDLVVNYKIAQKYVSNAKRAMAIRGDVIENFLRLQEGDKSKPIDIQEWKKLRGMLHPDKLMQNQSKPFQYINEIINR